MQRIVPTQAADVLAVLIAEARDIHCRIEALHAALEDNHDPIAGPSVITSITLAARAEAELQSLVVDMEQAHMNESDHGAIQLGGAA